MNGTGLSQFITLPLPPSVNSYWQRSSRGVFISRQGVKFRQQVAEIVAERNVMKFGASRLFVAVRVCMRNQKKADIDNRLKSLLDALEHAGVYDDDEQIDELHVVRGPITKGGQCYVMISITEESKGGE